MKDNLCIIGIYGGIIFVELLTIILIILKICNIINWSWLLVLTPVWLMAIITMIITIIVCIIWRIKE